MVACNHHSCGSPEKIWVQYLYQGREMGLRPHTYCQECGLIRSTSSDRPRGLGYYVNVISSLKKELKLAQVQVRLLVKEMERRNLDDDYGLDRYQQEKLFVEIVKSKLNVSERTITKFL